MKTSIITICILIALAITSVSLAEQPSQHSLSVHVVDANGNPVPWGIVNFRQEQADKNYISIGWQKVNENGVASMTIPDGVYSVVSSINNNPVGIGTQIKVMQDEDVYHSFYIKLNI